MKRRARRALGWFAAPSYDPHPQRIQTALIVEALQCLNEGIRHAEVGVRAFVKALRWVRDSGKPRGLSAPAAPSDTSPVPEAKEAP